MVDELIKKVRDHGFDKPIISRDQDVFSLMLEDFTGQWKGFKGKSAQDVLYKALKWINENLKQINFERKLEISRYRNEIKYSRNKNTNRTART